MKKICILSLLFLLLSCSQTDTNSEQKGEENFIEDAPVELPQDIDQPNI